MHFSPTWSLGPRSPLWGQLLLTNFLCISPEEFYASLHMYYTTASFFCPRMGSHYSTLHFLNTILPIFLYPCLQSYLIHFSSCIVFHCIN